LKIFQTNATESLIIAHESWAVNGTMNIMPKEVVRHLPSQQNIVPT